MDISRGLLELQSTLEGTDSRFVDLFVKSLGFLVRFGFQKNYVKWQSSSAESHPFVKVKGVERVSRLFDWFVVRNAKD